ncbi:MAG: beta-lactamase family protein [Clostridia bacterium]|nr:beta-lactamase family protein [Clostridia bacterium]
MRKVLSIFLLFVFLFPALAFGEETDAELRTALNQTFKSHKTTGGAIIVARGDEIIFEHYYGTAVKSKKIPVSADTYFKIASVTKLVSALRVMQLVESGQLDLDADISQYLGYEVQNPYYKKQKITLRMLMTHTSSLNQGGGYARESNTLRSLISTDKVKRGNWYKEVPGSKYRYSNFGAGIMGSLIEAVDQINVQDSVYNNVFQPLKINAAYNAGLLQDPENVAGLYKVDGSTAVSYKYSIEKAWDSSVNPDKHYRLTVGSLWMKPTDLCRIGMLMLNAGELDGVRLLEEDTVAQMMESQEGKGDITAKTPYGLCTHREETLLPGKVLYGHQGMSGAVLCNMYFDPETELVFVLCTNGCNNQMSNHVGHLTRKAFAAVWDYFN